MNNQTGGSKMPLFFKLNIINKMRKPSRPSYESFMLLNGKKGQVFYTSQQDKNITTLASRFGVKITTENMFAIKSNQKRKIVSDVPEAIYITKVTLL